MTIKHNFYVFFGLFYFVLLALGLSAGFALGHFTDLNAGYAINILSFCAAAQLSATRFGGRYVYIEGPSPIGIRAIIQKKKYSMPLIYAIIGVNIDMFYYAASSFYFRGEFQELSFWRLFVMIGVYWAFSYVILTSLDMGKKNRG